MTWNDTKYLMIRAAKQFPQNVLFSSWRLSYCDYIVGFWERFFLHSVPSPSAPAHFYAYYREKKLPL